MPFYAYIDEDHKVGISASDVNTPEERSADYYCPGCTCKLRYRSGESNKVNGHFYRPRNLQHDKWCWMPTANSSSDGDISAYDWDGYSLQGLLQTVQTVSTRSGHSSRTAGGGKCEFHRIKPTTIRQLYHICCENPNRTQLPDGSTIRDIFCGRKTAYFYTNFCNGIKLVEVKFHCYNNKSNEKYIEFAFPYSTDEKKPNFFMRISIKDENTYKKVRKTVYKNEHPILILANWASSHRFKIDGTPIMCAEVVNLHQVVPMP